MSGTNAVLGGGGFHHVAIRAADFDASVRFYIEVLGFTKAFGWGEGDKRAAMLDTGDGSHLEVFAGGKREPKSEGAYLHVALRTQDVAGVIERVRQAGMEITMEPKDIDLASQPPRSLCIAFFKGPDGEIVELFNQR